MSEEEIKQLMKEEMQKTIKENLHSEMIFVYVDNLEKENKQLKSILTELEKWLKAVYEDYDDWKDEYRYSTYITAINETFDKIQELKEKYK